MLPDSQHTQENANGQVASAVPEEYQSFIRMNDGTREIDFTQTVRGEELKRILQQFGRWFCGKDLLEIGSGAGFQLRMLASLCRSSVGLEVHGRGRREEGIAEVREYDGRTFPFPDASFDVIYSSQVLQYLTCEPQLYAEMQRVLRPGGVAIHAVPTSVWRSWTSVLHYPAKARLMLRRLFPATGIGAEPRLPRATRGPATLREILNSVLFIHRHGSKGNWLTEHFTFRRSSWVRRLASYGWTVERIYPLGLWYSGHQMMGARLSLRSRERWAGILGSSTMTILARPANYGSTTPHAD